MSCVAVIQARMGSSRLPGKVMLSLNCTPVIRHVVRRTLATASVDVVVVATSRKDRDTIITRHAAEEGAETFRGDEDDVLGRMYRAAKEYGADSVVRITADNPLLSPAAIDAAVLKLNDTGADYVSNKIDRMFPSGLDVETFTFDSFTRIERQTEETYHREHVTPYYRKSDEFNAVNLDTDEVFGEAFMRDRTDLRLTLDTSDDYELFRRIYENVAYEQTVDVRDAVTYVDKNDLGDLNTS